MSIINRVHGEVDVDLGPGVHAAQETSLPWILEMAQEIWAEISRSRVAANDNAGNDRLLTELQRKYSDFAISCPLPLRWMVQTRKYIPRAFEKFLRENMKLMYKNRKEFLAAQGEYLVNIYKIENPRAGVKQINSYREIVKNSLERDSEAFKKAQALAKEEACRSKDAADADRRGRICAYLKSITPAAPEHQPTSS